jgi:hypothetical protein
MLNLTPTNSPTRLVVSIPGVPEDQARALDRRRRLNRQLQSFFATDRDPTVKVTPPINERAEPIPA